MPPTTTRNRTYILVLSLALTIALSSIVTGYRLYSHLVTPTKAQSIDFTGLKTEYKKYRGGGQVDPICFDNQCNPRFCVNTNSSLDGEPCQSNSQCNGRDVDLNGVQGQCYDNWWEEQIGCPQWLADSIINGITTGPTSNRNSSGGTANYVNTLQSCSSYRPSPNGAGANGAWLGLAKFSVGLALEDSQITMEAAQFMAREPASRFVPSFRTVGGEGITQDWAHYTHQQEMQNHYGSSFLSDMATYMAITKNDPVVRVEAFPGVDPNQSETADENMCAWVSNHVKWVNHFDPSFGSPYWDPLTSSKFPQSARSRFERGINRLLNSTNYCTQTVRNEMKGIVGQGNPVVGAMSFPIENYVAVKRSNFTAGLRMAELGNLALEASPVNPLYGAVSWVTNATIDKWYGDEDTGGDSIMEYPHRLLGLATIPRDDAYVVAHNYKYSNGYGGMGVVRNNWPLYSQSTLGGYYAAGGEWLRGGSFTMKKSWFFFDNEIVSLGSDISDAGGVDTWLNSFIKSDANFVTPTVTRAVNTRSGTTIDDGVWLSGSDTNFGNISWLYHDNTGYVFPQTEHVRARGVLTSYRGPMVQTFLSHTEDNDPTYAVVLLPGATQSSTQSYNDLQVVELSGNAHVVKEVSSGTVGAVIFSSNYVNSVVSSNLPATIMYRQNGGDVQFSLYNPHLEAQTDWWGATSCSACGENPKDDYDISSSAATKHAYIVKIPLIVTSVSPSCSGNACSAVSVTSGNTINVNLRVTRKLEVKINSSGQVTEANIGLNDADAGTTTAGGGGSNPTCGDGTCNGSETITSCPVDCNSAGGGGGGSNLSPLKPTLTLVSGGGGGGGGGAVCGNNTIESGEACDGTSLNNKTCITQGFTSGTLTCNTNCTFDTSACTNLPPQDVTPPTFAASGGFAVTPANTTGTVTLSWNVVDTVELSRVEIMRAPYVSTPAVLGTSSTRSIWQKILDFFNISPAGAAVTGTTCDETSKSGCQWVVTQIVAAPAATTMWQSSTQDTPPSDGSWWYGIHVVDAAGNRRVEPTPPGPIKVIKTTPVAGTPGCTGECTATTYPPNTRYFHEVFSTVTTTKNIPYSQSLDENGQMQTHLMDIYEPSGDTAANRSVIIWIHGGGFMEEGTEGNTKDDMTAEPIAFAKRGYVTISINYRTRPGGVFGAPGGPTGATALQMRLEAQYDAEAAVRWLRCSALAANPSTSCFGVAGGTAQNKYKIDPNKIAMGGASAGGGTSMMVGYNADNDLQSPRVNDNVSNAGYVSTISSVIDISGQPNDQTFEIGEPPIILFHSLNDPIVPYILAQNAAVTLQSKGMTYEFHTFSGSDHAQALYNANTSMMNAEIADFLYRHVIRFASCATPGSCRYLDPIFPTVDITTETYVQQIFNPLKNQQETLTLDVCQPRGDTLAQRPVLVYFHGGFFLYGSKNDNDAQYFCKEYAKRGYVGITANYRLGVSGSQTSQKLAMALSDMGATVRWTRANATRLKLNPNLVFIGGFSAGAVTSNHFAFDNDTLPGDNTAWSGYSNDVKGVFALDGSLNVPQDAVESDSQAVIIQFASEEQLEPGLVADIVQCNLPASTDTFLIPPNIDDFLSAVSALGFATELSCFHTNHVGLVNSTVLRQELAESTKFFYEQVITK